MISYRLSIYIIDKLSRRVLHIQAFSALAVVFFLVSLSLKYIRCASMTPFLILFLMIQFLTSIANSTSFVLATEVFPTRFRSTSCGISSAIGELGTIFAQSNFFFFFSLYTVWLQWEDLWVRKGKFVLNRFFSFW